jgi:hypothetical protein
LLESEISRIQKIEQEVQACLPYGVVIAVRHPDLDPMLCDWWVACERFERKVCPVDRPYEAEAVVPKVQHQRDEVELDVVRLILLYLCPPRDYQIDARVWSAVCSGLGELVLRTVARVDSKWH